MRLDNLLTGNPRESNIALQYSFLGQVSDLLSKQGARALRAALQDYALNFKMDEKERELTAIILKDDLVVTQINLIPNGIAIAARSEAPFAKEEDGFAKFAANVIRGLATTCDLSPADLEAIELKVNLRYDSLPVGAVVDSLWDKTILQALKAKGLDPYRIDNEVMFFTEVKGPRCYLRVRASSPGRHGLEGPANPMLNISFAVALLEGFTPQETLEQLTSRHIASASTILSNAFTGIVLGSITQHATKHGSTST